jgi:Tfp pilus assembly protein PilF
MTLADTASRTRTATMPQAMAEAVALQRQGRLPEAATIYAAVLAADGNHVDALRNLSIIRRHERKFDEALALIRRAIAVAPKSAEAHDQLGNILQALNRPAEAIGWHERAIALRPDYVEAYNNLGIALAALHRLADAIAQYEKALALKADYAEVHYNESIARLGLGDFAAGWRKYEWRWDRFNSQHQRRNFPQPLWLGGESIEGKTILLHADQGLGCTLQFIRYLPLVARRGARAVIEVQRPLVPLLAGLPDAPAIVARGDRLPDFDFHCPLLSLPLAFATTIETIPADVPYLAAPAPEIARWRAQLPRDGAALVGLAWAGNPGHANDHNRSIALRHLLPLLRMPGIRFVSLQHELRAGDAQLLDQANVLRIGERVANFADTAAVVSCLDVVITVDTAIAHLAGALGKPTWVLLPFSPDWRWFLDRSDSPFYPTARLFRQPAADDWESVAAQVGDALNALPQRDRQTR